MVQCVVILKLWNELDSLVFDSWIPLYMCMYLGPGHIDSGLFL